MVHHLASHFSPVKKIFTDVYMYDPTLCTEIQTFAECLEERTRTLAMPLPTQNYDLVLDIITMGKDNVAWAYHYVDHDSKTLFWQDYYDCGGSLLSEVRGVREASHVSAYFSVRRLIPCG